MPVESPDNRRREFHQAYHSETYTLASCLDVSDSPNVATYVKYRIRIVKRDRRLPLFLIVAFEPDGGSPDNSFMATDAQPCIAVQDLILRNRSYVPVHNRVGNMEQRPGSVPYNPLLPKPGFIAFPNREGALGIALEVGTDVDAVDAQVYLYQALGDFNSVAHTQRYGGRWTVGYSFTCKDRLSREEWELVITSTNMQIEIMECDKTGAGTPVLVRAA